MQTMNSVSGESPPGHGSPSNSPNPVVFTDTGPPVQRNTSSANEYESATRGVELRTEERAVCPARADARSKRLLGKFYISTFVTSSPKSVDGTASGLLSTSALARAVGPSGVLPLDTLGGQRPPVRRPR